MTDEIDSGIDKQKILAEIGASAPLPGEPPPPPRPPAPPRDVPAASLSAMAPPSLPPPAPAPVPLPPRLRQGRLARHRRQIAAIVLVFASLVWFGVALATEERAPFAFGGGFLGLAILIGAGSLLHEA